MDMLCEWCGECAQCAPCALPNGHQACLCAFCENQLIQQLEDSELPDDDESQPGNSPKSSL
ncbi:hypothetical protein D3C78_638610 [compost metagenome]